MLKPMLDVNTPANTWRGTIVPSTAWFAAYQSFINYWADFAEANNCEMLCIGCEFENTSSWAAQWRFRRKRCPNTLLWAYYLCR